MSHSFKKVWNVVSTVLVALVVLLAVALVGVRLVGLIHVGKKLLADWEG